MKRWWLAIALLLSVGLNLGILATLAVGRREPPSPPSAEEEREEPGGGPALRLERLADRLGLAGAERERFLDLQWQFFRDTRDGRRRLADLHFELRRELLGSRPNPGKVDGLLDQTSRAYRDLEAALARTVVDTRQLLDPDQERIYLEFLSRLRPALQAPLPGRPRGDRPFLERRRERRQRRFGSGPV